MYLKIVNELGRIDELPTIPQVLLHLNSALANPKTCAKDIAELVEQDQVLTTRILKLVNAAFYGYSRKITTLTQAIVIVGFREIKNLVLASKTFDFFKSCGKKSEGLFDVNKLWKHSAACAAISKKIAEKSGYEDIESLLVAGLIHDIGKVVEIKCLWDHMPKIFSMMKERNISMDDAEQEVFNVTHAEIGKVLADMWDFPPMLEEIVAYHHTPQLSSNYPKETAIIHIANSLCWEIGIGSSPGNVFQPVNEQAWGIAGIDEQHKKRLKIEAEMELTDLLEIFT